MAVAGALLVPGCFTFEDRHGLGIATAHAYGSPGWVDPGLYEALPGNGTYMGFRVASGAGPEFVGEYGPFHYPKHESLEDFRDPGLEAVYGDYALAGIRYRVPADDPRDRMAFELHQGGFDAWIGHDVPVDEAEAALQSFVAALGADNESLDWDAVVASGRTLPGPPCRPPSCYTHGGHYWPGLSVDGLLYSAGFGPLHLMDLFRDLGGVEAFEPQVRNTPLSLAWLGSGDDGGPFPFRAGHGIVDLIQGNWEFTVLTPSKLLLRGPYADQDAFVVVPGGGIQYAHWGAQDLTNREAASELKEAVRALGREPPETKGWTFTHEWDEGGGP